MPLSLMPKIVRLLEELPMPGDNEQCAILTRERILELFEFGLSVDVTLAERAAFKRVQDKLGWLITIAQTMRDNVLE